MIIKTNIGKNLKIIKLRQTVSVEFLTLFLMQHFRNEKHLDFIKLQIPEEIGLNYLHCLI